MTREKAFAQSKGTEIEGTGFRKYPTISEQKNAPGWIDPGA